MAPCNLELLKATLRGADQLDPDAAAEMAAFVAGQMNVDGGFRGRDSQSDLYYTLFALGCLLALDAPAPVDAVSGWLDRFGDGADLDFVHTVCLLRCHRAIRFALLLECRGARFRRVVLHLAGLAPAGRALVKTTNEHALLERIESHRVSDGGYSREASGERAKATSGERAESIYAGFLAMLAREDCGLAVARPREVTASVRRLRAPDGGFADAGNPGRGSTPATAAAAILLQRLDGTSDHEAVEWLKARACAGGGFCATPAAPTPDLLSTATALHALRVLGVSIDGLREATLRFVESLWDDSGGLRGDADDPVADCEYTWYGLLALGSLV